MKRQTYFVILLFLLLVIAKTPAKSQKLLLGQAKTLKSHQPVYLKDREFVYAVKFYNEKEEFVKHDTLIFISSLKDWHPEVGQTESIWRRKADTMKDFTGITENDTIVWIHPYRSGDYRILEFSPFPVVKYPLQTGNSWNFDISVGEHWGSKDLIEWKGVKLFKAAYKLLGNETLHTKLGKLACYKIKAEGSSDFGKTQLLMYFNESYGFVRLEYQNINQTSILIELIDETFLNPAVELRIK